YLFSYAPCLLRVLRESGLPPGRVEFIVLSGGFIPGMAMSQMIVRDEKRGFEFVAEGIHFRYASPADLFKGRFVVDTFTVDKVVTKMSSKFYERAKNSVNPLAPPEAVVVQVQAPDPSVPVLDPNSREAKARRLLETAVHKLFTDPDAFVKAVGIHELRVSNSEVQYQKSDGAIEYERLKEFRVADLLYHPS